MEVKENSCVIVGDEDKSVSSAKSLAGWHLDRVDQQALPLDHKYTASQYTGKSVDVYVLTLVFTIITAYSMVELTIQDVIQLTS